MMHLGKLFNFVCHHLCHHRGRFDENELLSFFQDLKGECSVLDLGCGDGFFTKMFLKKCREVVGVDLDDSYFKDLNSLGIKTYKADICSFNQGKYDLIFMSNVFHGIVRSCNESFYENLYQMSKRYVAILDFKMDTTFGPPKRIRIPKEKVVEIFQSHGFKLAKEKDLRTHFLLLFEKIERSTRAPRATNGN